MTKATRKAAQRGLNRGVYVGMTGDTRSLSTMRRKVENYSSSSAAQKEWDRAIRQAIRASKGLPGS